MNQARSAGRSMVLLGAGASADAGLLLTSGLAGAIIDKANEDDVSGQGNKPDWVRALNAVYAGMVGYQGSRGGNPRSAVNIETLISAVRLLRNRDEHEVAPFVATWAPALSTFGSTSLPNSEGKSILNAVSKAMLGSDAFADQDITNAVANIATAAVRPDLVQPFEDAEHFVIESLVELLSDHRDVGYLKPLIDLSQSQAGGLDIITLNYDLTVEAAAAENGVPVNRGVDSWTPGKEMAFPAVDGTINLLKLHGSLDWQMRRLLDEGEPLLSPSKILIGSSDPDGMKSSARRQSRPWIVVGDREKLATDGPTLALNFAARSALSNTDRLVIVGYSFRDAHINAMIRDWMAADSRRTMTLLDRTWPRGPRPRNGVEFRDALVFGYAHAGQRWSEDLRIPRVLLVEGTAASHLSQALSEVPAQLADPLASVHVQQIDGGIRLDVTWHGPDMSESDVQAKSPGAAGSFTVHPIGHPLSQTLEEVKDAEPHGWSGWVPSTSVGEWLRDEMKTFYATAELKGPVQLSVSGDSLAGPLRWHSELDV